MEATGSCWPSGNGEHEALTTAAQGKELRWSEMDEGRRDKFRDSAVDQWNKFVENKAVKVLTLEESKAVMQELKMKGEEQRVLTPRFVMVDKNAPLRTKDKPLPLRANSRHIVPGFKDIENLQGGLRKDAPTASRISQHLVACMAAQHPDWCLQSADVRAAFLKGDPYVEREIYMGPADPRRGPTIPIGLGCVAKVLKGIFGLADAPRAWYLRLARELSEDGWCRSSLDLALWLRHQDGELVGILAAHVDDLLMSGNLESERSLLRLGERIGFGSIEKDQFVWCGKQFTKSKETGEVTIDMITYHKNLKQVAVSRDRRQDPSSSLNAQEQRQLRGALGSLQWLAGQCRFDLAFDVSALQGEVPVTIGTLLRANKGIKEAQATQEFKLRFHPIDFVKGGVMSITDAALGNVDSRGSTEVDKLEKVHSQSCYAIVLADEVMMSGWTVFVNLLDFRSHRLQRVCRSFYAAETLGAEEGLDAGELCRGFIAELRGQVMTDKQAFFKVCLAPLMGVTDAKDCYDRVTQDLGFGTQKSLAFTIAAIRQQLRRPQTFYRWTSAQNMWVDGGTKHMDKTNLRKTLERGTWSVTYNEEFTKQTSRKAKKADTTAADLPGRDPEVKDEKLMQYVYQLAEMVGWHYLDGTGRIHVAHGAKSLRSPQPRFAVREYPLRTTVACWKTPRGPTWRVVEERADLRDLQSHHGLLTERCERLVTFFHNT